MTPSSESLALVKWSKPGVIYVARNLDNGKLYVGQTTQRLCHRKRDHRQRVEGGSTTAFHCAIRKRGLDRFDFTVVQRCYGQDALNAAEVWWISSLKCMAPHGYNLTSGGDTFVPTEETRRKRSESLKGRVFSAETIAKMSAAHKGNIWTEEARAKLSRSITGRKCPNRPPISEKQRAALLRHAMSPRSAQHRENISKAQKGRECPWSKGKAKSPETRARMSAATKGKPKPWLLGNRHGVRKTAGNIDQFTLDFDHG